MCAGNPTAEKISSDSFSAYARLHTTYWGAASLLKRPWLRGSDWAQGQGEASWSAAQDVATNAWAHHTAARAIGESPIVWDPHLVLLLHL